MLRYWIIRRNVQTSKLNVKLLDYEKESTNIKLNVKILDYKKESNKAKCENIGL